MSTLEKFGILVILILVVIIGVVAVWGVGGDSKNPFGNGAGGNGAGDSIAKGDAVAGPADTGTDPGKVPSDWPATGGAPSQDGTTAGVAVAPPTIGTQPTPAAGSGTGPSAGPAAPGGTTTYTVKAGDTPSKIALATLGDRNRWPEIMKANPGVDPRRLKISMVLNIPGQGGATVAKAPGAPGARAPKINTFEPTKDDGPSEVSPAKKEEAPKTKVDVPKAPAPAATPDAAVREYVVQSGDTLYEIARKELGDPNLYYKILKANPGLDPKKMKVGMKIKVPAEK
jgi:nucleoid-associated protein YgaU